MANAPIALLVDDRVVETDVPLIVHKGRTLVPIRAVAEALGVAVHWDPGGRVLVYSHPMYFSPVGGGDVWQRHSEPQNLNALGAVSALTRYLADKQATLLNGKGPYLVRFEFLDLRDVCAFFPPDDLSQYCEGFRIATRLYYVRMTEDSPPPDVAQYERIGQADGSVTGGSVPRSVQASWYEDVIYDVRPSGRPIYHQEHTTETVTYGTDGWAIDSSHAEVHQRVTLQESPYLIHGSFGR